MSSIVFSCRDLLDASTCHECRHQSKKRSFAFHELTVTLSGIFSARRLLLTEHTRAHCQLLKSYHFTQQWTSSSTAVAFLRFYDRLQRSRLTCLLLSHLWPFTKRQKRHGGNASSFSVYDMYYTQQWRLRTKFTNNIESYATQSVVRRLTISCSVTYDDQLLPSHCYCCRYIEQRPIAWSDQHSVTSAITLRHTRNVSDGINSGKRIINIIRFGSKK